jgi:hypothetical protein
MQAFTRSALGLMLSKGIGTMTLNSARIYGNPDVGSSARPLLDRALAGRAFSIDALACAAGAQILRTLRPDDGQERLTRPLGSELLFRTALSAICHQINWDFLSERLSPLFDARGLDARGLSTTTARDVGGWLAGYHRPERTRVKERAALLRDVGATIIREFGGKAENLLEGSGRRLHGSDGFMARLDRFQAFRDDPLRKKSNVLVHEIVRDRIANFDDSTQIAPAIDYHIMRLYLRSGRVLPLHRETLDLLKKDSAPRPRLVKLLREAVSEAVSLTALYAGMSIPQVNSLEWQIGRSVCDRGRPNCSEGNVSIAARLGLASDGCPYAGFCRAFADKEWRLLREPNLMKSFY